MFGSVGAYLVFITMSSAALLFGIYLPNCMNVYIAQLATTSGLSIIKH